MEIRKDIKEKGRIELQGGCLVLEKCENLGF